MDDMLFEYTMEPCGAFPTQAEGLILETGQAFYFRYRGGRASLTISLTDTPAHGRDSDQVAAYFEERVLKNDGTAAFYDEDADLAHLNELERDRANRFVTRWVTAYLAGRK